MTFKWIIFTVSVWIVLSFLCGIVEGALLSGGTGETQSTLNTLMKANFASMDFWKSLGSMIVFNFPALFTGSYKMLQWIFFLPLAMAFGMMMGGFILSHIPVIGRGT